MSDIETTDVRSIDRLGQSLWISCGCYLYVYHKNKLLFKLCYKTKEEWLQTPQDTGGSSSVQRW